MPLTPPATATRPRHADFVGPLALATLLACIAMVAWFLLQALVAWPLAASTPWQLLLALAAEQHWPASLRWLLAHPVAGSLSMAAVCVPSLVSSWGLYRGRRWGLLSFTWLLVITAVGNLGVVWWLDHVGAVLLARLGDPEAMQALQIQRRIVSATLLGSCLLFAALQGWLAWRLMRPDIRARFPALPR